jgi:hypothetical protein
MSEMMVMPMADATMGPPPIRKKRAENHVSCRDRVLK